MTFHIVHAEPCEHELRTRCQQAVKAGLGASDQAAFRLGAVRDAVEQMERYRSQIEHLQNRLSEDRSVRAASEEKWAPFCAEAPHYQVSSTGRVRGLARLVRHPKGLRMVQEREYKIGVGPHGYNYISLFIGTKNRTFLIHRLVASVFISPPPDGLEVNHKNGIKTDNRVENLEWVTARENLLHKTRVLGHGIGEAVWTAKLKPAQVLEIRTRYAAGGISQEKLAEDYGVKQTVISDIILRKIWKHVPSCPSTQPTSSASESASTTTGSDSPALSPQPSQPSRGVVERSRTFESPCVERPAGS
jgi:hypothetical protein